ncbi:MAG: ABC transporter permease subunit [Clostridiales bacterium]|jgi:putative aldouronate transport system permease protein|nr:ABC transporter permease subunit [Clostridiales bacterium]
MEKTKNGMRKNKRGFRADLPFYGLLAPAVVFTLVFAYLPMGGILIAFKNFDARVGYWASPWADNFGFQHFIYIFKTPAFTQAMLNTLYLNVLALLAGFPAPLLFALLLNEVRFKPAKRAVQTVSYLPYFLAWISVTGLAVTILAPDGIVNNILYRLGAEPVLFLQNPKTFTPLYLFLTVWKSVGWGSIIFLANIAAISSELYEAATLDGANRWKRVWHITLPALLPTTMILLILQLGQLFGSNFELVYGLQNAYMDTDVISTAVYKFGLGRDGGSLKREASTALGLMQSAIALGLTLGANFVSKKVAKISLW